MLRVKFKSRVNSKLLSESSITDDKLKNYVENFVSIQIENVLGTDYFGKSEKAVLRRAASILLGYSIRFKELSPDHLYLDETIHQRPEDENDVEKTLYINNNLIKLVINFYKEKFDHDVKKHPTIKYLKKEISKYKNDAKERGIVEKPRAASWQTAENNGYKDKSQEIFNEILEGVKEYSKKYDLLDDLSIAMVYNTGLDYDTMVETMAEDREEQEVLHSDPQLEARADKYFYDFLKEYYNGEEIAEHYGTKSGFIDLSNFY